MLKMLMILSWEFFISVPPSTVKYKGSMARLTMNYPMLEDSLGSSCPSLVFFCFLWMNIGMSWQWQREPSQHSSKIAGKSMNTTWIFSNMWNIVFTTGWRPYAGMNYHGKTAKKYKQQGRKPSHKLMCSSSSKESTTSNKSTKWKCQNINNKFCVCQKVQACKRCEKKEK